MEPYVLVHVTPVLGEDVPLTGYHGRDVFVPIHWVDLITCIFRKVKHFLIDFMF